MQSVLAAARLHRLGVTALVTGLAAAAVVGGAGPSSASSHREAPLIAGDPAVDNTDLYAFVSPDKPSTVTLIANWLPFQEPNGGPNFYPWQAGAHYDINIDNDGDAVADVVYRWTFSNADKRGTDTFLYNNGPVTSLTDPNLLYRQRFTLSVIKDSVTTKLAAGTVAPSRVGNASMPDYGALRAKSVIEVAGGGRTFVGQADDPFFLDLRVFDLLYGQDLSETGQDTLRGYNVNSLALQVPKSMLALGADPADNPVIGIWSSTSKQTMQLGTGTATPTGSYVQVSRLGNPLVNEVVVPSGLKDAFNGISPDVDATMQAVVDRVTHPELPQLIESLYGIPAPETPRNDLVEIFLTGIAKDAPTLDSSVAPIQADLNSQILNADADPTHFVPSEMLRLNMAVAPTRKPYRLGVLAGDFQGFPNGRRLTDDVLDIAVQAVEGAAQSGELVEALASGDGVDANERAFGATFPYVALPNTEAVNRSKPAPTVIGGGASSSGTPFGLGRAGQAASLSAALLLLGLGAALSLRRRRSGVRTAHGTA